MQASPPSKLLLSATEAAKALSISPKSLWLYSSPRGPIPVVRLGSRVLYDPRDLRAWIERAKGEEEPEPEDDYEAGSTAELIRAAESGEEFILAFALCRLENAIFTELDKWPDDQKPEAADRLEQIARELRG